MVFCVDLQGGIIMMTMKEGRVKLSRTIYLRAFLILFVLEVAVEGFGYHIVGRWIDSQLGILDDTLWAMGAHLLWMLVISTPILYGWLISQLKRQQQYTNELHDKDNEFLSLFSHNSDAVFTLDTDGKIVNANPAAQHILEYSLQEMLTMGPEMLANVMGQTRSHIFFERALQGKTQEYNNFFVSKTGRTIQVEEKFVPFYRGDEVIGVYVMAKDITERWEAEEEIWKLAHHDHLTGLPNRRFFSDQLARALRQAQEEERNLAVLFIDLDRFKNINDALGHDVGDEVLKIVSRRMSQCVRDQDILARFGGDEFAVLLPRIGHVKEAKEVAERILETIQEGINFDGYEFYLTSSIGIAVYPVSGESPMALLRNADTAMFSAKRHGKNQSQVHLPSMHEHAYKRFRLENDLRQALQGNEQLFLEYQPQVDVMDGTVVGAEALIRWHHPVIGLIPPDEFIPMAEGSGLIEPLGEYVLRRVCRQIQEWMRLGKESLPVAVNVSPVEMGQDRFVDRFRSILAELNIPPRLISIEITESTLMKNGQRTLKKLKELKALGIKIFVDDFGRGYSSLGFLKQFPVDVLKVDKIFVQEMDSNYEDASIVSAVITLAHSRQLKVIAEGVEREQQLAALRQSECDEYQGYFFSHSISPDLFAKRYL